ncbi:MAG TPA: hypothetical protein VG895_01600 [Patescibacteria group bacterium]|nr:hypothetical protein [Patescibacteria group bacterium]
MFIFRSIKRFLVGCLLIVVILIILGLIFSGVIIKKVITGAIQQKTGVSVNVDNNNKSLTYTDPKTGQTLSIGNNKIPDNFPKDFPIYPGSSVTTSLSGNQNGQGNGYWLTLNTKDSVDQVISYYKTNLQTNGWSYQDTTGSGVGTNWVVSKNDLSGYMTIETLNNQTSIIIVLGVASPEPASK